MVDPVEGIRFERPTAEPVEPTATGTDAFVFPVTAATTVETTASSTQHHVVGDARTAVARSDELHPSGWHLDCDDGSYAVRVVVYPSSRSGIGGVAIPYLSTASEYRITFDPGPNPVPATYEAVRNAVAGENQSVGLDGELTRSLDPVSPVTSGPSRPTSRRPRRSRRGRAR